MIEAGLVFEVEIVIGGWVVVKIVTNQEDFLNRRIEAVDERPRGDQVGGRAVASVSSIAKLSCP